MKKQEKKSENISAEQAAKFIGAVHELNCDQRETSFEDKLRQIAKTTSKESSSGDDK